MRSIRVGVCTPDVPAVTVASIDELVFKSDDDSMSQTIIATGGEAKTSAIDLEDCAPRAIPTDVAGVEVPGHCCRVEVIPNSLFFPDQDLVTLIHATGTAILAIDGGRTRRLRINRDLLEQQSAEFETTIPIQGSDPEGSSAATSNYLGAAGLALGALLV